MRISIGQKLTLSFLLVSLLVGILGFVGFTNMMETAKQIDVITEQETPALIKLTEIKSHILEGIEEAFAYPLLGDPVEKTEFYTNLEQFDASVAEFREIARIGQPGQTEETQLFKQIVAAKEALKIVADNMFESYEIDGRVNLSQVAAFESEINIVVPLIDRFLEIEKEEVAEAREEINATIANAERQTLIVVSVAVVVAIGLGFLVSRSISIPINKLKDVAEELGKGNLGIRANIKSGDEIGSLATSFDQMAGALQQAEVHRGILIAELEDKNAELEQFTYTVSHDLKSPLITIKGFLGALEQDIVQGNTERMQADIARISAGADRMSGLLDELLELSRIGRVVGSPEEVPLGEVAREAVALVAGLAEERKVRVTVSDGLPVVFGDRLRIREVLQNLVENAIKFMGEQPDPIVEIGELQRNGESVCFVRDNGMGIDPRFSQKVFDLFDKLDRNTEGTGIGLALVKRIVEVHRGRVWVESEGLGHGSTFYFTLPSKRGMPHDD
ncbi:MAG: HAMP domain-containing protein [Chloroflexi bacterium]|nr:HAMP domain-containing protein [Chloroflexota bacterium]